MWVPDVTGECVDREPCEACDPFAEALGLRQGTGAERRDAGATLAANAALPWSEAASRWIVGQAPGALVTAEDVTAAVGLPNAAASNRNNAVGAALLTAARAGVLVKVGYQQATRKESHARVIAVWQRVAA